MEPVSYHSRLRREDARELLRHWSPPDRNLVSILVGILVGVLAGLVRFVQLAEPGQPAPIAEPLVVLAVGFAVGFALYWTLFPYLVVWNIMRVASKMGIDVSRIELSDEGLESKTGTMVQRIEPSSMRDIIETDDHVIVLCDPTPIVLSRREAPPGALDAWVARMRAQPKQRLPTAPPGGA